MNQVEISVSISYTLFNRTVVVNCARAVASIVGKIDQPDSAVQQLVSDVGNKEPRVRKFSNFLSKIASRFDILHYIA